MLHSYIGVHALQEGDKKKKKVEGQLSFSIDGLFKRTPSRLFFARHYVSGHMATNPQCLVFFQETHTHTNTIKSVLTGDWQMWKVRGNLRQECKGRGRKVWIFSDPVEIKPVGFFCSCSSNLLYLFRRVGWEKADVLYLQMAEVSLQSVDG